ncbi:MAG: hypothetical protein D6715_04760 [Calditrichaeota bacterium]|nr:MAG: hypothetical protein D6715_04760 [Calditrichota bacterium]
MGRIISLHEYELKNTVEARQFEQAVREAIDRGLFLLPGLEEYRFLKGLRGSRAGKYAALWIYRNQADWEALWGPVTRPRPKSEYPAGWQVWEDEILKPLLDRAPDKINYTAYRELDLARIGT